MQSCSITLYETRDPWHEFDFELICCALDHQPRYSTDRGVEIIGSIKIRLTLAKVKSVTPNRRPNTSGRSTVWKPSFQVHGELGHSDKLYVKATLIGGRTIGEGSIDYDQGE